MGGGRPACVSVSPTLILCSLCSNPALPTGVESVSSPIHPYSCLPFLTPSWDSHHPPVCPSLISSSHQDHTGLIWLPFPNTQFLLQTESPSAPLSHSGGHCLQHGSHSWWDPSPHCPWPKSARAHCGWSHLLPTPSSFSNCMTGTFPLAFQSRDLSIYMKLTLLSVY